MIQAMNLAYCYDLLPQSSDRQPERDVQEKIKRIHPDLEVHWISICNVCGFTRPGDLRKCPGKVVSGDYRKGLKSREFRPHKNPYDISGYWGVYLRWPMYQNYLWQQDGKPCAMRVIDKYPMFVGWIPAHLLRYVIYQAAQVVYPDPNDNLRQLLQDHDERERLNQRKSEDIVYGHHDEKRWIKQRLIKAMKGHPFNPLVHVPRALA